MCTAQMTPPPNRHQLEGSSLPCGASAALSGFQKPWLGLGEAPQVSLHLSWQKGLVTFLPHCSPCILTVSSAAALGGQGETCRGPNRDASWLLASLVETMVVTWGGVSMKPDEETLAVWLPPLGCLSSMKGNTQSRKPS